MIRSSREGLTDKHIEADQLKVGCPPYKPITILYQYIFYEIHQEQGSRCPVFQRSVGHVHSSLLLFADPHCTKGPLLITSLVFFEVDSRDNDTPAHRPPHLRHHLPPRHCHPLASSSASRSAQSDGGHETIPDAKKSQYTNNIRKDSVKPPAVNAEGQDLRTDDPAFAGVSFCFCRCNTMK